MQKDTSSNIGPAFPPPPPPPPPTKLTDHEINDCNKQIEVTFEPATYSYSIVAKPSKDTPAGDFWHLRMPFHRGDPARVGVNGITIEILIAIVIDRLEAFEQSNMTCIYNKLAITFLRGALALLKARADERASRGVQGKQVP
jgi:hypothetical protein